MLFLTLKTDNPQAEIGLFEDTTEIKTIRWQAHRKLAETIHKQLEELLQATDNDWSDIEGILFFEGPGSFTGLRIGASLANSLASGLDIPVVSVGGTPSDNASTVTSEWAKDGIDKLIKNSSDSQRSRSGSFVSPLYGQPVHITQQKK
jgi:tRNA threonylcarbamoyladenosine biosynthesis protein TsaB